MLRCWRDREIERMGWENVEVGMLRGWLGALCEPGTVLTPKAEIQEHQAPYRPPKLRLAGVGCCTDLPGQDQELLGAVQPPG